MQIEHLSEDYIRIRPDEGKILWEIPLNRSVSEADIKESYLHNFEERDA